MTLYARNWGNFIHRSLESKTFKSQKVESPRQTLGKTKPRLPREVSILGQRKGPAPAAGVAQESWYKDVDGFGKIKGDQ